MPQIRSFDGGEFAVHLSLPSGGRGPGVVVIQEIFGVNANIRSVCDWLAERGFAAAAPDLFWRAEPGAALNETERDRAFQLRSQTDDTKAALDVSATMDFLRSHTACTGKVGTVGYCWGGMLSYLAAARHKPDAAVSYYGVGIDKKLHEAGAVSCPLMMHFAELDKFSPPAAIEQIQSAFAGNPEVTVHTYANCDHAFARKNGMHYDAAAAELANLRTVDFFVRSLQ